MDEEEQKGEFTFDGYYYVRFPNEDEDEETKYFSKPPKKIGMYVKEGNFAKYFLVELLTRKMCEDTSEYWSDSDEGGRICLFPTKLQTITFRVLEEL